MASPTSLITAEAYREHAAFWTRALGALSGDFHLREPWLSLPQRAPGEASEERVCVPAATEQRLRAMAAGDPLGLFAVIASATAFVLHVHAGVTVVAIDTPPLPSGVDDLDIEEPVPLVFEIDREATLRDQVSAAAAVVARSYSYQQFPIAHASEALIGRPRPRTNVLARLEGLHAPLLHRGEYGLEIVVSDEPGLPVVIRGRAPACSHAFVRLIARHLVQALDGYADLSTPVRDLDVMGADERRRLLDDYGWGRGTPASDTTIAALFSAQAAKTPDAVAIELDGDAVDYATLERQSNQLARALQADYAIGPGHVVGVLVHRSPLTIAALLGVLKAGAVYLPVDPEYPEERLQFMVSDADVRALLVHSAYFDRLGALYETPMFALDLQLAALEHPSEAVPPACRADAPAYIIYTSGSTGRPKAVVLGHRGFVNMVQHHVAAFGIDASDRLLQFYNLSFDSSLFEIFVTLLSGATLVMTTRETIDDPSALSAYIEARRVTTLTLPPVYQSTLERARLSSVRRFVSAGDACRVDDATAFARKVRYFNSYGPTECSVCVTHFEVHAGGEYGSRIPIGRPIANTSIYLLDDALAPVPEGVVGEICVGGVSLAHGYLHREALTAEAFVPSPFAPGERLYRTGDLGVWLPDGNLELVGRKDNQVKVRGYRIELGEIEAVLLQVDGVGEAAVIARDDDAGHRRLVAYVTGERSLDAAQLRAALESRLPAFMVPALFVVLETMPVTANGKIDRKALPAPVAASAAAPAAPVNDTQARLLAVWRDVLGQPSIGIHDNLFELGGDSIIAIQIASRARQAGLKLAPNQLFEHQTVAALAEVAVAAAPLASDEGPLEGPCPLGPMQEWFFDRALAEPHHFNQSVSIDIEGGLRADVAERAILAVLTHHDALRLRFRRTEGRWAADYGPLPATAPFERIDLRSVAAAEQDARIAAAMATAQAGFDLSTGPLLRALLFDRGSAAASRLFVVVHHLAIDGVSWRILVEDLRTACDQAARGERIELPAKTTSYRTWARRLRDTATHARPELAYWLAPERAAAPTFPADHVTVGPCAVATTREAVRRIDADTTAALLSEVPRAYLMDTGEVLLAALARTIAGWSGSDRVLIDVEAHGRDSVADEETDTSRTIGWFTSQYPVLLRVVPDSSCADALKSVKEQVRAVPRRGAGYGVLRYLCEDAGAVAALKALPPSPVLFNYIGQGGRGAETAGWRIASEVRSADVSRQANRSHAIDVNALVVGDRLEIAWSFSEAVFRVATIEQLATRYEETLRAIVDDARRVTIPQYTPSDFPAARLSQQALDALVAKLSKP